MSSVAVQTFPFIHPEAKMVVVVHTNSLKVLLLIGADVRMGHKTAGEPRG